MIFAILRSDYLEFVRKKSVDATHQLSSAYTFCAAKLLHVFVWTTKKGREPVQITQKQIREQYLLSEHGKDAIATSMRLFEELGILARDINDRRTNNRNGQNKTYRYKLNYPRLCELLGFEPQDIDEDSVPDDESDSSSGDCSPQYKDPFNTFSNTTTTDGVESEESEEEVKTAIANSPREQSRRSRTGCFVARSAFVQEESEEDPIEETSVSSQNKFSEPESNNSQIKQFLRRLRLLRIPPTKQVKSKIKKTPLDQLRANILALEEEAATKGLDKPLAAFFACVKDNWQPRNDKQSWWERAAIGLGRERRLRLISCVTELWGRVMVCFANGRQIPLDEAMTMEWDAIAQLGGEV